ncbi:GNAT family N-acetyltransferase [Pseudomonas xantholysinigenes]|uniref:GNAT family N-acetyltransferase n=1 Tax=Pseudomonas xantholysinigenes TaxID=2745490 RepID=A0A9E6Q2L6_9PSED|nr:GNAT family N-acetyltransferase [Pseudomonas xantholysinigenes]QXI40451.1 GNAT family N-acetyltransferase [Pseudomonas xantholysinigenes]
MSMRIEMVASPGDEERSAIVKPLRAHNRAKAGDPKIETIALLVRDEHTQEVLGGLWAEVFYRWLYIELLAIPEQSRGQGIGTRLIGMAEEVAREKGCIGIWLDTFDFQAPAFYERNGFSRFANLEDFPPGHTRFYYQKRLV